MGAELAWAKAKLVYRKLLHSSATLGKDIDHLALVAKAMNSLTDTFCRKAA
jgi:hypothetical protein